MQNPAQVMVQAWTEAHVLSGGRTYKAPHANIGTPKRKHFDRKLWKQEARRKYLEGFKKPQAEKYLNSHERKMRKLEAELKLLHGCESEA